MAMMAWVFDHLIYLKTFSAESDFGCEISVSVLKIAYNSWDIADYFSSESGGSPD